MKRALQFFSGLVISVLFLWLAFRKTDLAQVFAIMREVDKELMALALCLMVGSLAVRSYRWKLLGARYRNMRFIKFFKATTIGLMLNMFLPFRSGDFFQSYFIAKAGNLPKSYTISTVALERLVDVLPPLIMLLVGSLFVLLPREISVVKVLALMTAVGAALALFLKYREQVFKIVSSRSPRMEKVLDNFASVILFAKDRQVTTRALPLTFFNWFIVSNTISLLMLHAFDIRLNFFQVFLVQAITVIAAAIPSSPGFVGTWEFFCILSLSLFGVDRERALSYAILSHFWSFLPPALFGLGFFSWETLFSRIVVSKEPTVPSSLDKNNH